MRLNAGLSKIFWVEAVNTKSYLVNRSPSTTIDLKTPQEVWYETSSDYSGLRIFGCPAYAHVNNGKLEARAIKCIFLGYATGVKGYKLWCTNRSPRFIISTDVTFNETVITSQEKEFAHDLTSNDHGAIKKVDLSVDAPKRVLENTLI